MYFSTIHRNMVPVDIVTRLEATTNTKRPWQLNSRSHQFTTLASMGRMQSTDSTTHTRIMLSESVPGDLLQTENRVSQKMI